MVVTTSLGTASASMASIPGNINFSSNGASVTALNPGTYNAAIVEEIGPAFAITYQSTTGANISNPFTFPSSAYGSSPATYYSTFCTAGLNTALSGTANPTGAFVGSGLAVQTFNR